MVVVVQVRIPQMSQALDKIQLGKVLVAELLTSRVRELVGEQVARVRAYECALRYVVQAPQAPALVGRLEQLQANDDAVLHDTVRAAAIASALGVALENACIKLKN